MTIKHWAHSAQTATKY